MAFGPPPPKDANAGAPVTGIKLTDRQKFDYHFPGLDYLNWLATLTGVHPGILNARLDVNDLGEPGAPPSRGGAGVRAPKGPAKPKPRGKKAATDIEAVEELPEVPTDARDMRIITAARKSAYLAEDGVTLVCPVDNLKGMFIEAAKCWPGTGLARACGAGVVIEGSMLTADGSEAVPFLHPQTGKPLRFDNKVQVVQHPVSSRNPPAVDVLALLYKAKSSTGKRIATARPYIPAWKLQFKLGFDAALFQADGKVDPVEVFRANILAYAGAYIGLMSWRPGAPKGPGPFGRYQLTEFESTK